MALVVNNTDELFYSLTTYGLDRIAEALKDKTIELNLFKIKVGDAEGEYYIPEENVTELKHELPNGTFYILSKELLEDGETISLHTIFPETFDNCEIREVGIYETVDGEDKLFAISTMQPLVKPSLDLEYVISVDYYAFLKSQNLAALYDQIILRPESQLITQEDLDKLMNTILYTESNLMEQVNSNTRVIGLNRTQQLYESIQQDKKDFGYLTTYNNYASLLNFVDSKDVYAYWIFDYPRKLTTESEITDIGRYNRNLSISDSISSFNRSYKGFTSFLNFESPKYFYLEQSAKELVYFENGIYFMPYLESQVQVSSDGIAYGFTKENFIEAGELDISRDFKIELKYKVGTASSTASVRTIMASADGNLEIVVRSNNTLGINIKNTAGTKVNINSTELVNDNIWRYIRITFSDGTLITESSFDNEIWQELDQRTMSPVISKSKLFIGKNASDNNIFNGSLDLKYLFISSENKQIASGGRYEVPNELTFLDTTRTTDTSFTLAFVLEPIGFGKKTLLARSSYSNETHIFEISETAENSLEVILFNDSDNYLKFTTPEESIPRSVHSLIVLYNADTKELTTLVNGKAVNVEKEIIGTYNHMNDTPTTLYGFMYTPNNIIYANRELSPTELYNVDGRTYTGGDWSIVDGKVYYKEFEASYNASYNKSIPSVPVTSFVIGADGSPERLIDSSVGTIVIVKDLLSEEDQRTLSLLLEAARGKNPCIYGA